MAVDVAFSSDGSIWALLAAGGGQFSLARWTGAGWDLSSGGSGLRVAADTDNAIVVVDTLGGVSRFANGQWEWLPGSASDVSAGPEGRVLGVDAGVPYEWFSDGRRRIGGRALLVAAGPGGRDWMVKPETAVYRR
jgi:hypothetical protein